MQMIRLSGQPAFATTKFALPVESSNDAIRNDKLQKVFQQLADDLKPEAGYFFPSAGERGGFFVVDTRESSQVAEIAERFFFGLNAKIQMTPVMNADDLQKALAIMPGTIKRYG